MRRGRHKATSYPLTKISVWVGTADWAWLQARHPYNASRIIRDLVINYRHTVEDPHAAEELAPLDLEGL